MLVSAKLCEIRIQPGPEWPLTRRLTFIGMVVCQGHPSRSTAFGGADSEASLNAEPQFNPSHLSLQPDKTVYCLHPVLGELALFQMPFLTPLPFPLTWGVGGG